MNQWIESRNGKWYWFQQFPKAEMELLKKYHVQIGRMTKIDFSRVMP